ncbi:DUF3343 domain-containing protein [Anaerococcus sp. Marseille-P3625]|uniref:DUF3343 domain-containing protein n=1 Tax=Anaerococcus sp. Marseille-P3625 TaxID=1977277 RepID=UPI00215102DC|nr:DUF3343 domain-containing protein [Anaerococcus sp. Marseille-P3625]
MKNKMNYILFKDVENGKKLYDLIKNNSIKATIAPTPRILDICCGISILYDNIEDKPKIEEIIKENNIEIKGFHEIERDIDPNRMKFL